MNKDLKHRVFDIPQNILDKINHTINGLNGQHFHGLNRAQKLLNDDFKRIYNKQEQKYKSGTGGYVSIEFPELSKEWAIIDNKDFEADQKNEYNYSFIEYDRYEF